MNQIADAMEPYLRAAGIRYGRNDPATSAAASIRQGNQGNYDFYLALHSNASGDGTSEGRARGIIAFYFPTSANGKRAAELIVKNLRAIYPLPYQVSTRSTTSLGEVRQPRMPAVLVEIGYHDNTEDANWVSGNIQLIAQNLVESLCQYFGLPFIYPIVPQSGVVTTVNTDLNLRDFPALTGAVVGRLPRGATVTVYGQYGGWYSVWYGDTAGYASAAYIQI